MNDDDLKSLTNFACETARFVCVLAMVAMLVMLFGMISTCTMKLHNDTAAMSWFRK